MKSPTDSLERCVMCLKSRAASALLPGSSLIFRASTARDIVDLSPSSSKFHSCSALAPASWSSWSASVHPIHWDALSNAGNHSSSLKLGFSPVKGGAFPLLATDLCFEPSLVTWLLFSENRELASSFPRPLLLIGVTPYLGTTPCGSEPPSNSRIRLLYRLSSCSFSDRNKSYCMVLSQFIFHKALYLSFSLLNWELRLLTSVLRALFSSWTAVRASRRDSMDSPSPPPSRSCSRSSCSSSGSISWTRQSCPPEQFANWESTNQVTLAHSVAHGRLQPT